jgi:predicted methyltransferase MtxX (methanogen marker protein 4)
MPPGRKKGSPKAPGSGRKPGTGNRYTEIRKKLLQTFDKLDIPDLVKKVREVDPVAALKVLVSLLPKEIDANVNGQLSVSQIVEEMQEAEKRVERQS